ncbi:hypothetical protein GDO81_014556 [Engystomops pustulosus]|uniref:Uncharacterized protein n=1 Tax=Engystomops pustulosus TaxID=76066 RepID=A0AAV7BBG1_ENGPU|nr:hypothetical protein GDO81_014556 [Engystomops pustulosus]KAG8569835.1 hypothetical protein GDO81_014556 [Engystomops pustulosus]
MCLKYNLQDTADCVSRQREAAMSLYHHTFLIDCDTGVCVCLTGAPQPRYVRTSPPPSSQTPTAAPSRRLFRTCLTSCMKEQRPDAPSQDLGASPQMDKIYVKQETSTGHLPKTMQKAGGRFLQDRLKQWIRRLASCVRSKKP